MTLALTVDPSDPRPIYVQIMDEMRRALVRGALDRGDPISSVRELARELRVNPNTVQQAYRELEREGLIETRRGRGSFVAPGARIPTDARDRVVRQVAEAALRDASRAGITAQELVNGIQDAVDERSSGAPDGVRRATFKSGRGS